MGVLLFKTEIAEDEVIKKIEHYRSIGDIFFPWINDPEYKIIGHYNFTIFLERPRNFPFCQHINKDDVRALEADVKQYKFKNPGDNNIWGTLMLISAVATFFAVMSCVFVKEWSEHTYTLGLSGVAACTALNFLNSRVVLSLAKTRDEGLNEILSKHNRTTFKDKGIEAKLTPNGGFILLLGSARKPVYPEEESAILAALAEEELNDSNKKIIGNKRKLPTKKEAPKKSSTNNGKKIPVLNDEAVKLLQKEKEDEGADHSMKIHFIDMPKASTNANSAKSMLKLVHPEAQRLKGKTGSKDDEKEIKVVEDIKEEPKQIIIKKEDKKSQKGGKSEKVEKKIETEKEVKKEAKKEVPAPEPIKKPVEKPKVITIEQKDMPKPVQQKAQSKPQSSQNQLPIHIPNMIRIERSPTPPQDTTPPQSTTPPTHLSTEIDGLLSSIESGRVERTLQIDRLFQQIREIECRGVERDNLLRQRIERLAGSSANSQCLNDSFDFQFNHQSELPQVRGMQSLVQPSETISISSGNKKNKQKNSGNSKKNK